MKTEDASTTTSNHRRDPCCDCRSICGFPMGMHSIFLVIATTLTFILGGGGMGSCNFVRVNGQGWGLLWREETVAEDLTTSRNIRCTAWDDKQKDNFDAPFKFAMAFAYLAIFVIVIASSVSFALACATLNKWTIRGLGIAYIFAGLLQVLAFTLYASDVCDTTFRTEFDAEVENCSMSFGSGLAIAGITFSLLATLAALSHPTIAYQRTPKQETDSTHADEHAAEDNRQVVPSEASREGEEGSSLAVRSGASYSRQPESIDGVPEDVSYEVIEEEPNAENHVALIEEGDAISENDKNPSKEDNSNHAEV